MIIRTGRERKSDGRSSPDPIGQVSLGRTRPADWPGGAPPPGRRMQTKKNEDVTATHQTCENNNCIKRSGLVQKWLTHPCSLPPSTQREQLYHRLPTPGPIHGRAAWAGTSRVVGTLTYCQVPGTVHGQACLSPSRCLVGGPGGEQVRSHR